MGRRLLSWGGLAVLLAVAVASAGWHGPTPPEPPARRPAAERQATYAAAALAVRRASLVRGDLPRGFEEVLPRNRGERDAQDHLDLCGVPVPDPGHRLATEGHVYVAPGRRVRTDVVAYRPGYAEQALTRLRATPRSCARPIPPRAVQQPSALALRVRLGSSVQSAGPAGRQELLVLRSGDVLSLVEVHGATPGLALHLARLLGPRLQTATAGSGAGREPVAPQLPPPGPTGPPGQG